MAALWAQALVVLLVGVVVSLAIAAALGYRRTWKSARRWKRMGLERPEAWVERVTDRTVQQASAPPANPPRLNWESVELRLANVRERLGEVRLSIRQSLAALEHVQQSEQRLSRELNQASEAMHDAFAPAPDGHPKQ